MSKFTSLVSKELEITFSDFEKAEAYFIDSDYHEYMYDFSDMEDLVDGLSIMFTKYPSGWDFDKGLYKDIEGFGVFYCKGDKWTAEYPEVFGTICIEELGDFEADGGGSRS